MADRTVAERQRLKLDIDLVWRLASQADRLVAATGALPAHGRWGDAVAHG
jgi:hypothetical protein